jgi:hypothetical protein
MTFFTAAEVRPAARLVFTSWYYKCVGKSAAPACPSKRFCENDNICPTVQRLLQCFLHGISGYDNPAVPQAKRMQLPC